MDAASGSTKRCQGLWNQLVLKALNARTGSIIWISVLSTGSGSRQRSLNRVKWTRQIKYFGNSELGWDRGVDHGLPGVGLWIRVSWRRGCVGLAALTILGLHWISLLKHLQIKCKFVVSLERQVSFFKCQPAYLIACIWVKGFLHPSAHLHSRVFWYWFQRLFSFSVFVCFYLSSHKKLGKQSHYKQLGR